MPKGPSTTQYIGGIVADQLTKMAATIIESTRTLRNNITNSRIGNDLQISSGNMTC